MAANAADTSVAIISDAIKCTVQEQVRIHRFQIRGQLKVNVHNANIN